MSVSRFILDQGCQKNADFVVIQENTLIENDFMRVVMS